MKKMKKTKQVLKMYNSSTLKPVGQCMVQLQNPETYKKYKVEFTVIDGENCTNLLGSRAAQQMGLVNVNYDNMKILSEPDQKGDSHTTMTSSESSLTERATHSILTSSESSQTGLTMEQITSEYKDIFEGLGQLGPKLHLELEENVKPVQQAVRKIPESMKDPLRSHLAELEEKGIIERVYQPTEWISSIVVAKKSNGNIRLCLDPRPLNKALKRCHHPMQTIEGILPELGKAKVFSKLDCLNGYWQVPLDEESFLLTTFDRSYEIETENDRTLIRNRRHLKEAKSRSANGDKHQQIQELPKTPEVAEQQLSDFDGEIDPIPELIPDPDRGVQSSTEFGRDNIITRTRSGRISQRPKYLDDYST